MTKEKLLTLRESNDPANAVTHKEPCAGCGSTRWSWRAGTFIPLADTCSECPVSESPAKCASCGGDLYHYAGCAIGEHGQTSASWHRWRDLLRVIGERDAEIARLREQLPVSESPTRETAEMCECRHPRYNHYSHISPNLRSKSGHDCAFLYCDCRGFREKSEGETSDREDFRKSQKVSGAASRKYLESVSESPRDPQKPSLTDALGREYNEADHRALIQGTWLQCPPVSADHPEQSASDIEMALARLEVAVANNQNASNSEIRGQLFDSVSAARSEILSLFTRLQRDIAELEAEVASVSGWNDKLARQLVDTRERLRKDSPTPEEARLVIENLRNAYINPTPELGKAIVKLSRLSTQKPAE